MGSIKVGQLKVFTDELKELQEKIVNELTTEIQNKSPRGKTGNYSKGWTNRKEGPLKTRVFNNGDNAGIAHLLENGHISRNQHGTYGRVSPRPHIRPAYNRAEKKYLKGIENIKLIKGSDR